MWTVHSPLRSAVSVLALLILSAFAARAQDDGGEMEELYQAWLDAVQKPPYVLHSSLSTRLEEPSMVRLLECGPSAAVFLATKTGRLPAHLDYVLVQAIARARGENFSSAADFLEWREQVTGEKIEPFCFDSRAEYEKWQEEHPNRAASGTKPSLGVDGDLGPQKTIESSPGGGTDVAVPGDGESSPALATVLSPPAPDSGTSVKLESEATSPPKEQAIEMSRIESTSRSTRAPGDMPQEVQALPSAKSHAWAHIVVGLAAGLAVAAAGAWLLLRRRSGG
jgi:hypothetical protein